jgi:hypothetical protein
VSDLFFNKTHAVLLSVRSFFRIRKTKERVKTLCMKINTPLVSEIKKKMYLFDTMSFLNDFIDQHKRFGSKLDTTVIADAKIMFWETN